MEDRAGRPLRWWQRFAIFAALEHDEDGALVWPLVLVSTTRQVGKSYLLRDLILWRLVVGAELFGHDVETVLHVAGVLDQAVEVWGPAATWAERSPSSWRVRRANGQQEIESKISGGRWLVRAAGSGGFGFTLTMPVVDEAWRVPPATVDDGLAPAMAEPVSAQLWIVSTAHPAATPLVPTNRGALLAELTSDEPGAGLLLEWSARPELRSEDRTAWREASPYWDDRRERFVADRLEKAIDEASFRAQWLNVWPSISRRRLADLELWATRATAGPLEAAPGLWGAVEVSRDGGAYGAAVGLLRPDGTVAIWSRSSPRLLAITDWILPLLASSSGTLLVSVGLRGQLPISGLNVAGIEVGMSELTGAVANTQALIGEGRLCHDGSPILAAQVDRATIVETDRGPHLSAARSTGSVEAVKAMLFVIQAVTGQVALAPAVF